MKEVFQQEPIIAKRIFRPGLNYKCGALQVVLFLGLVALLAGCGSQVNDAAVPTPAVVVTTPSPPQPTTPPPTTPTAAAPATATTPPTAVPTDPAIPLADQATAVPEVTPRSVPGPAQEIQLNQPFTLALGQTARLEEADLSLTFSDLLEDSRCPSRVTCVWAGQAIITVRVQQGEGETTSFEMNSNPSLKQDTITYAGYEIQLTQLDPYPQDPGQPIPPDDYMATLVVSK